MARKNQQWETIEVDMLFDLGAAGLASLDLAEQNLTPDVATDNFIATSTELQVDFQFEQAVEPNALGSFAVGLAKSDYSSAEIEAWLESDVGFTRTDLVGQEVSHRHIKHIGTMNPLVIADAAQQVQVQLNGGMPIKTKLNWRILENATISAWLYNGGEVAIVASAGQDLRVFGQINGFWED